MTIVIGAGLAAVNERAEAMPTETEVTVGINEIQVNAFTCQGRLDNGGSPADGTIDFNFKAYESDSAVIPWAPDAHDDVAVGDGYQNQANGLYAVVPGGTENVAADETSFAAGYQARALHDGSFVWCDRYYLGTCETTADNEFLVRATGGVSFLTGFDEGWRGVRLPAGAGAWETASDRNAKRDSLAGLKR